MKTSTDLSCKDHVFDHELDLSTSYNILLENNSGIIVRILRICHLTQQPDKIDANKDNGEGPT